MQPGSNEKKERERERESQKPEGSEDTADRCPLLLDPGVKLSREGFQGCFRVTRVPDLAARV